MRFDFPIAGELNRLQNEMDRLLGVRLSGQLFGQQEFPPVNVWEDDDHVFVEAEIPGMALSDIELLVNEDGQLVIQGQRKRQDTPEHRRHRSERSFGKFSRTISLPSDVDADRTDAQYEVGVLTVRLAKKEEIKPRKIKIHSASTTSN